MIVNSIVTATVIVIVTALSFAIGIGILKSIVIGTVTMIVIVIMIAIVKCVCDLLLCYFRAIMGLASKEKLWQVSLLLVEHLRRNGLVPGKFVYDEICSVSIVQEFSRVSCVCCSIGDLSVTSHHYHIKKPGNRLSLTTHAVVRAAFPSCHMIPCKEIPNLCILSYHARNPEHRISPTWLYSKYIYWYTCMYVMPNPSLSAIFYGYGTLECGVRHCLTWALSLSSQNLNLRFSSSHHL